ncbi:MAG: phosphopentomutase [Clostridiales bacterium]|nr:phosphopentomutase [Clostridiales bacterium]
MKRVFIIVLDSFGVGKAIDAKNFGDAGADTLASVSSSEYFKAPNLTSLGLFNIDDAAKGKKYGPIPNPIGSYGRLNEESKGKDSTVGHWELAGLVSNVPFPLFPNGFPSEVISEFEKLTKRKVICNKPYSGTEVIKDYGEEHLRTGALIVYTSGDSVFQIAAHKSIVSIDELYEDCLIARKMLSGKYNVSRVIARPFEGEYPFIRTSERHDFSAVPESDTLCDILKKQNYDVIGIGKTADLFAEKGFTQNTRTKSNEDGMDKLNEAVLKDFHGICFANLVDFDTMYGHRRDKDGYAKAISVFDDFLPGFMKNLREDDIMILTADHGNDPCYSGTDHTRENVPCLVYGKGVKSVNLGSNGVFSDIAASVADMLGAEYTLSGNSFWRKICHD